MSTVVKLPGYGNIQLVSPYEVHTLSTLRIEKKANDHAWLSLKAVVPEEKKDSCIDIASDSDTIEIREVTNEGSIVKTLFHGVVSDISVKAVRGIYYLELSAVSHSYRMDVKRKTRSFQRQKMLYEELVQHILSEYFGSDCIDLAFNNAALDQFIVQYQETDWQFLKRMASRFGAVLVPEFSAASPKIWIGYPDGKSYSINNTNYIAMRSWSDWSNSNNNLKYSIITECYYKLGDRITFRNKSLVVTESIAQLHEGVIVYEYLLQSEEGLSQQPIWNEAICGSSLEGKVIDVAKDKVKVHLKIDSSQAKEDACWFPYSSPYVGGGTTGFYSMPQIGDTVLLYFPNIHEDEAFARTSIRHGGNSPKLESPGVKYWGNPFGKEIKFGRNELAITAQDQHVFIKLNNINGIELHSKDAMFLHTGKDISIQGGRMSIQAREAVYLVSGSSSIVLDGDTDIKGGHVTVKGLTKSPVLANSAHVDEKKDQEGNKLQINTELALNALGLIPGIGGALMLGAKAIASQGGLSTKSSPQSNQSSSMATYSKVAMVLAASIPSPLPIMSTLAVMNALDAAALQNKTKSMQQGKVYTAARSMQNNLSAKEIIEKLKLVMKSLVITKHETGRPSREPLPAFMNDVIKYDGEEKAYQVYKVIKEKGESVNREDAKKLGISYDGLSLLALSNKLQANGMSLQEADMQFREANSADAGALVQVGIAKVISKSFARGLSLKNVIPSSINKGKQATSSSSKNTNLFTQKPPESTKSQKEVHKSNHGRDPGNSSGGASKSKNSNSEGLGKPPVPTKPGGGSNPDDFVNPHAEKHLYDPSRPSTPNRSQYGQDVDVGKLRNETMTNPDKAFSNWPNPNNPNPSRITKYYKEFDGNISTPDTPTGSHRVFEHLDDLTRSSHFPYVPRN